MKNQTHGLDTISRLLYSACNSEIKGLKSFGAEGVLAGTEKLSINAHEELRNLRRTPAYMT